MNNPFSRLTDTAFTPTLVAHTRKRFGSNAEHLIWISAKSLLVHYFGTFEQSVAGGVAEIVEG